MKYIPLYNPDILNKIIDDILAKDPSFFTDGPFTCYPKIITPVSNIEIDRFNFDSMNFYIDCFEEFDPMWDDFLKRGGDKRTFVVESLDLLGSFSELRIALLETLADIDATPKLTGGQIVSKHIGEINSAPHGKQIEVFSNLAKKYSVSTDSIKQALKRYRNK